MDESGYGCCLSNSILRERRQCTANIFVIFCSVQLASRQEPSCHKNSLVFPKTRTLSKCKQKFVVARTIVPLLSYNFLCSPVLMDVFLLLRDLNFPLELN